MPAIIVAELAMPSRRTVALQLARKRRPHDCRRNAGTEPSYRLRADMPSAAAFITRLRRSPLQA